MQLTIKPCTIVVKGHCRGVEGDCFLGGQERQVLEILEELNTQKTQSVNPRINVDHLNSAF